MKTNTLHCLQQYSPSGSKKPGDRLVIFYHFPKCGGCTISNIFDIAFGGGHYGRVNCAHEWAALARSDFVARDGDDLAVSGHASWGIHNLFSSQSEERLLLYHAA